MTMEAPRTAAEMVPMMVSVLPLSCMPRAAAPEPPLLDEDEELLMPLAPAVVIPSGRVPSPNVDEPHCCCAEVFSWSPPPDETLLAI